MSAPAIAAIVRTVRTARRRLMVQLLINRLIACWAGALVLGLGWVLAEPWLVEVPANWLKWAVIGGLSFVGTALAAWLTIRSAPSPQAVALEFDSRFGLKERITTALSLRPEDTATSAGEAVLTDATAKVKPLTVATKFPIQLRWQSLSVPALAGCIALAAIFYQPNTARTEGTEVGPDGKKPGDATTVVKPSDAKKPTPFVKKPAESQLDRGNKSEKLKELENELEKLLEKYAKDPDAEKPEKQKEKAAEITALEDKMKKFSQEKFEKLARMEQQLRQLDRLNKDEDTANGPAKEINDALSKGDLKKAKDEVDELKKKVQDKKLTKEDQEKLSRQLDKMKNELERLAKNKEREEKLKDLIDQAKKQGKDAESLERELNDLKQENKQASEAMKDLAEHLEKAKQAAEKGDLDDLAEQLEQAGKKLENIEGELKDLEDAQEYLQKLKEEREAACAKCKGKGKGKGDKPSEGDTDEPNDGGIGAGKRPENKDAKTNSEDERIKGLFDPRGKKSFGGTTRGQAFTKRTTADLGKAIQEAVQEAPQAADSQRLPREAREAVKEYFQNLGGQSPGGNK